MRLGQSGEQCGALVWKFDPTYALLPEAVTFQDHVWGMGTERTKAHQTLPSYHNCWLSVRNFSGWAYDKVLGVAELQGFLLKAFLGSDCRPKLVTVPAKLEKREKSREAKAQVAAKLDRVSPQRPSLPWF